jgi:23S rRNA (adenine2503-C2)-methyltransferase
MPFNVLEMTIDQLGQAVVAAGFEPYRARQIADWVYRKGVTDPAKMTNLPAELASQVRVLTSRVADRADSEDGTTKLLLELEDGQRIEAVLIPTEKRATACLSTQVGCAFRCGFCATGLGGLHRNLTSGEMLQQLLHLEAAVGRRLTNVVFMGMGEPLANYDATVAAVRAIIDPERFALSARSVTVSTIGLPKQIHRLAAEGLPITLAISLHAPNDALRRKIIPAAGRTPVEEIVAAAQEFYESRNREITLEYLLLAGVNDSSLCAEALARIARRIRCNVNLIRYNPVESLPYQRPTQVASKAFAARLSRRGVNVHIRRSRGLDVSAACGQLRQRAAKGNPQGPDDPKETSKC